jgi:hypothetical protein
VALSLSLFYFSVAKHSYTKSFLVGQNAHQIVPATLDRLQFLQLVMHYSRLSLPLVALLALPSLALPHDKPPDKRADNHQGMVDRERADAVKAAFVRAWTGYKKYAFPHDELHPVSNSFSDSRYLLTKPYLGIFD